MTKYYVDDEELSEYEFYQDLEDEVNLYVSDNYDDLLDESCDEIHIGTLTFAPSQVLKNCDPIAYRCGIDDYQNAELADAKYEVEHGDEITYNGVKFRIEEDDDDE